MNRTEVLNDLETGINTALDGLQASLWTALPCIVKSVDLVAMTCEVQPAIQGTVEDENGATQSVNLPLLVDVPIVFPNAGGFAITFPIAVDDEVLVVMASRCIDAWWQSGGIQRPMEARMHDLSDGFAIPGPRSQPRVLDSISDTDIEIRNEAGTVVMGLTGAGKVSIKNATKDMKLVLDGMLDLLTTLNTDLTTFFTVLSGLPPSTPVVGSVLATPANAVNASIATLSAQITAYKTADIGGLLK